MQITLRFMQVRLDLVTSANGKFQLQFQQTNNYQLLHLTSSTYFQSAAVMGRRITNSNLHKALSLYATLKRNYVHLYLTGLQCKDPNNPPHIAAHLQGTKTPIQSQPCKRSAFANTRQTVF